MRERKREWKETEYGKKLRDPRWRKKRLEILTRDDWCCRACFDSESTLNVHHSYYQAGKEPWDYPDESLITLCEMCHEDETEMASGAKSDLITILCQRGLLYKDLTELCGGFIQWVGNHPEVDCTVLSWALGNPEMWAVMKDSYFQFLAQKSEKVQ